MPKRNQHNGGRHKPWRFEAMPPHPYSSIVVRIGLLNTVMTTTKTAGNNRPTEDVRRLAATTPSAAREEAAALLGGGVRPADVQVVMEVD